MSILTLILDYSYQEMHQFSVRKASFHLTFALFLYFLISTPCSLCNCSRLQGFSWQSEIFEFDIMAVLQPLHLNIDYLWPKVLCISLSKNTQTS